MIYVFNKDKIFSYLVSAILVVFLFFFSVSATPNNDVKLEKVSSNIIENNIIINK